MPKSIVKVLLNCSVYCDLFRFSVQYQFGCGILKMVGPKKQDFWPKITILKRKPLFFKNTGSISLSKIGHDFRK